MTEPFRVTFLAVGDSANLMTHWSKALNACAPGYESKIICIRPNPFQYKHKHDFDLDGASNDRLWAAQEWIQKSEALVLSEEKGFDFWGRLKTPLRFKKLVGGHPLKSTKAARAGRLFLYHTGSTYRRDFAKFNRHQARTRLFRRIVYGHDLLRLGPVGETDLCIPPTVDADPATSIPDHIRQKFQAPVLTILHVPSRAAKQGSIIIEQVVGRVLSDPSLAVRFKLELLQKRIPNPELVELKRSAHIYIDQFDLDIGGFGVTSVESLAAGDIVVSQISNVTPEAVRKGNRHCPDEPLPIVATGTTEAEFERNLRALLRQSRAELQSLAHVSYSYFESHMSWAAVARKLVRELFSDD